MGDRQGIDQTHPAFRAFLAHIEGGAALQDIYADTSVGYAVRPQSVRPGAKLSEESRRRALDEFRRLEHHDRDLAGPIDRCFGLAGKRVLSFGCGTGALSIALARRGAKVVGVDPTESSLAACLARARYYDLEAGRYAAVRVGTAPGLPFRPASFDLVVSNSVMEFIPDDRPAYIQDLLSLIKPHGLLVISTANGLFPRDYYSGRWFPLLRRASARQHNLPYGLTWFEIRRWVRRTTRPVQDLSTENHFNSLDKLVARRVATGRSRSAARLDRINRLYKRVCGGLGLPSSLLFPYATFIFRVHPAAAQPPLRQPSAKPEAAPQRRHRAA